MMVAIQTRACSRCIQAFIGMACFLRWLLRAAVAVEAASVVLGAAASVA
jgi:hypothetical protein